MFEINISNKLSIESLTFSYVIRSLSMIGREDIIKYFYGMILVRMKKNADPRRKAPRA